MNRYLHIAVSSDDNYVKFLGVTIQSLQYYNRDVKIYIHVLDNGIQSKNRDKIESLISHNNKITFYSVEAQNEYLKKYNLNPTSLAMYSRIFLSKIIPENVKKIIYCDVDSLFKGSLKEIWKIDFKNELVAGVEDLIPVRYKIDIGLQEDDKYINSGFLLINLEKWREEDIIKDFIKCISKFDGKQTHYDQGVINAVCKDRIIILSPRYNLMTPFYILKYKKIIDYYKIKNYYSKIEIENAKLNPVFVHFVPAFTTRPWMKNCRHPLVEEYRTFLEKASWSENNLLVDPREFKVRLLNFAYIKFPIKLVNNIINYIG